MKPFATATAILLAAVAIVHALRLTFGWSVRVGDTDIPTWASIVGGLLAAVLAIGLWRERPTQRAVAGGTDDITANALRHLLNMNEHLAMSAKVLNAAFPPGVASDGVGRDNLRKLAEEHARNVSFAGGHSDTITFERKPT